MSTPDLRAPIMVRRCDSETVPEVFTGLDFYLATTPVGVLGYATWLITPENSPLDSYQLKVFEIRDTAARELAAVLADTWEGIMPPEVLLNALNIFIDDTPVSDKEKQGRELTDKLKVSYLVALFVDCLEGKLRTDGCEQ